jgi:hypothetical protein
MERFCVLRVAFFVRFMCFFHHQESKDTNGAQLPEWVRGTCASLRDSSVEQDRFQVITAI